MTINELQKGLGEQFKRLNNPKLKGEELKDEISRAKAVCGVSGQLISNGRLALDAQKALTEGDADKTQLPMLAETKE